MAAGSLFLESRGRSRLLLGVNQFILHTSAHQPWMNVRPGVTMDHGHPFRQEPDMVGAIALLVLLPHPLSVSPAIRAVRRRHLLSRGREDAPAGYDSDTCSEELFLKEMTLQQAGSPCHPE